MTSASASAATPPFRDSALTLHERVDDLLERLTLDERLAMLHQYVPAVPRLGIAAFRTGTEALHGVAGLGRATVFPQAVGLGSTWDEELVHAVGEAVSAELRALHRHRPAPTGPGPNGLQVWSPVVNLLRDPRWGRNEEGYSEDPLHTSRVATAYCRGLTGDHPAYLRTAPVLKHFLANNNETDRSVTSSGLRPRVLHEYDLAAFRPVIASGAATGAMAAYNLVNGRPCHVSPLLERELRAWARPTGHELFVVSDEGAPTNLVTPEHYFDDHAEGHAAALKAGIDNFTDLREDSATVIGRLRAALERGLIDEQDVNRAVRRQLQLRFRLGEFDPDLDPYAGIGPEVVDCPEHRALARRAAAESVVLLKNDGLLPLAPARAARIAVIGPHADALYEDWYSGTLPYQVGIATALRAALAPLGGEVVCVPGTDRIALRSRTTGDPLGKSAFDVQEWGDGVVTLCEAGTGRYLRCGDDGSLVAERTLLKDWFVDETFHLEPAPDDEDDFLVLRHVRTGRYAAVDPADGSVHVTADGLAAAERWQRELLHDGTAEARAAAASADAAIVVLGNHPMINGRETEDRSGIALPEAQEALLRTVAAVRPETALVVMSSYPYAVDWADTHLPAVLWTSHGGQETGHALAAVLLGEADPGGRLPQTWYRGDDELPDLLDYDIIKTGWTYQYHHAAPLYPFGHGLSYADVTYRDLRLSAHTMAQDGTLDVSVTTVNSGSRPGSEVVQLYVRPRHARYQAPRLRLADFRKVRLEPGETRRLDFRLPAEQFAHWDVEAGTFTVDPGDYDVLVARSAGDVVAGAGLRVTGPPPVPRTVVGRRTRACDFDDHTRAVLVDATRAAGDAVAPFDPSRPTTLLFRSADLTGAVRFAAEVAREEEAEAEGEASVEVRAGERSLGRIVVPVTGDRYAWTEVAAELSGVEPGPHDLTLILRGRLRLAAFRFHSSPADD
ncbi:glycoside hydrolase family 3 C-terminal domain-containing protein [Streptomyces sp. NPDC059866]|uniref:glycoside hydrolase family 3 C-terminal domain-containing protein n=1 Tax=Streptomyces sp. NPDC059866 TaxID=3346978 RepID=UPI0036545AB8